MATLMRTWAGDPRIIGSTPFTCDLCMATGWVVDPCPFHAERTWAEWLADALREWGYTIIRAARREGPAAMRTVQL